MGKTSLLLIDLILWQKHSDYIILVGKADASHGRHSYLLFFRECNVVLIFSQLCRWCVTVQRRGRAGHTHIKEYKLIQLQVSVGSEINTNLATKTLCRHWQNTLCSIEKWWICTCSADNWCAQGPQSGAPRKPWSVKLEPQRRPLRQEQDRRFVLANITCPEYHVFHVICEDFSSLSLTTEVAAVSIRLGTELMWCYEWRTILVQWIIISPTNLYVSPSI